MATPLHKPSGTFLSATSPISGRTYHPFVPDPLPPQIALADIGQVAPLLAAASQSFGQLAGVSRLLPDPDLLVRPYMRREAILSSRIENTHTSFSELVAFETTGVESPAGGDAREVLQYVLALEYGLRHVLDKGITMDLVRAVHRHLLVGGRGAAFSTPGEVRTVQNHIGGGTPDPADARYVPPPPLEAQMLLLQLIEYLAPPKLETPALVEAAWMHYQFEAIHPFLDGNGRVGRVLIPLLFAYRNQMDHPLLYLSPYFERDRAAYYDTLLSVSTESTWVGWLRYFLQGILDQATAATDLAKHIIDLGAEWHRRLDASGAPRNAHRLADFVHRQVAIDAKTVTRNLGVTSQTAYNLIRHLVRAGILEEFFERGWGQVYIAPEMQQMMEDAS